jgi:hypothetical protein
MLKEIHKVRQITGENKRRWFTCDAMDLIVWVNEHNVPAGFQLCYGKGSKESAITWTPDSGIVHTNIDDGEHLIGVGYKATPILVPGKAQDILMIKKLFAKHSEQLPTEVVAFVELQLHGYTL